MRASQTLPLFPRREGPCAWYSRFWLDFGGLQSDGAGGLLQDLPGRILTQLRLGLLRGLEVTVGGPGWGATPLGTWAVLTFSHSLWVFGDSIGHLLPDVWIGGLGSSHRQPVWQ